VVAGEPELLDVELGNGKETPDRRQSLSQLQALGPAEKNRDHTQWCVQRLRRVRVGVRVFQVRPVTSFFVAKKPTRIQTICTRSLLKLITYKINKFFKYILYMNFEVWNLNV